MADPLIGAPPKRPPENLGPDEIIDLLGLSPHPEGGHYRETWRDAGGQGTAIYFLLRAGERSHWHRVTATEVWHLYAGGKVELSMAADGAAVRTVVLGTDLAAGDAPQVVVEGGCWQSARPIGGWALVGCTVVPAFELDLFELAPVGWEPDQCPTGTWPSGSASPKAKIGVRSSNVAPSKRPSLPATVTSLAAVASPEPTTATTGGPDTLAIDVGGTGVKASVLDPTGKMEHDRVRVPTPYPLSPKVLIETIADLVRQLPPFERISLGFPGMVRDGKILTAPHFLSTKGADGKPDPDLVAAWRAFDLQAALTKAFAQPAKVANDADLQGAAVVAGEGLELVVTLGTGVGTGLFYRGRLCPHLELAQHPFRADKTYNEVLGEAARKKAGNAKWNERVALMITTLHTLVYWDRLYLGGGNATHVKGKLPDGVSLIDNTAGVLGGIRLWEQEAL